LARAFALAGVDAVSPVDRASALETLHGMLWSAKYSFVIVGDPWSTELSGELRSAMIRSPIPIVVLKKNQVDYSGFLSSLSDFVGGKVARGNR